MSPFILLATVVSLACIAVIVRSDDNLEGRTIDKNGEGEWCAGDFCRSGTHCCRKNCCPDGWRCCFNGDRCCWPLLKDAIHSSFNPRELENLKKKPTELQK
uniref:Cysteine rich secreted protein n=1 Tax=Riptortus pedestris TaxID=329032 RepID=R4WS79_RIPPE|nr:cysteine rich secreted protein [Riptortus pedestris]